MKAICLFILALSIQGCIGLGSRESSVTYPDGTVYKVRCQSDGKINFEDKNNSIKISVDNTGPAGEAWAVGLGAIGKRSIEVVREATK